MKIKDISSERFTQNFVRKGLRLERQILAGAIAGCSSVACSSSIGAPDKEFFASRLNSRTEFEVPKGAPKINYIDLFSGGGGLSLGVHEAIQSVGLQPKLVAAYDLDPMALSLLKTQFKPLLSRATDVSRLVDFTVDHSGHSVNFVSEPIIVDRELNDVRSQVQLLVGGPPCQGHSNLNNRTRGSDERNRLYYIMPAVAISLDIPFVIIENVVSIKSSHEDVTKIARNLFESAGYGVQEVIIDATKFGVAQTRRRHFMVATKTQIDSDLNLANTVKQFNVPLMTFDDINYNTPQLEYHSTLMESAPDLSQINKDRIKFLHDNDVYDLPNQERPDCHKDGTTYKSVYGRMRPNLPAPTITGGFNTPGRGRFVHPHEARVINIREASRIQGFPDWYWEPCESLGFLGAHYKKIIGDAVPPPMVHPIIFALANQLMHEVI